MARAAKKLRTASAARRTVAEREDAPPETRPGFSGWVTALLLFVAAAITGFIVYAPSLNGDFVFDDRALPMMRSDAPTTRLLQDWLGARPLLMLTYWLNYKSTGLDPAPYHAVNILLHAACAVLVFFAVKRILEFAGVAARERFGVALFGGALFLLHPLQTEAVSYIASRSENLSVFLFLSAFTLFLYRKQVAVSILVSLGVLVLYLGAMTAKEHTVMLPALLLLTDYFWNPGFSLSGIRRNWKLYIPIALGAAGGILLFLRYISKGSNAGFGLKDFTWYQYLFTQFRALFVYFRLFLFPVGQSVDYGFPVSHSLFDYGAIFYGLALLVLVGCAVYYRKRYPVACYGFFVAMLLFAPTSSIMPIKDTLAERRVYLPFIGLVLIVAEAAVRTRINKKVLVIAATGICVVLGVMTYVRNGVWVSMESLWHDAYLKNPDNSRVLMGLGTGYAAQGKCADAIPYFQKAVLVDPQYKNVFNLAGAYDCAGQLDSALTGYQNALKVKPSAEAWVHIGLIQMKKGRYDEAYRSLDAAEAINAGYVDIYCYRGILDLAESRFDHAQGEFQKALARDPANVMALRGMNRAQNQVRQY